jgi:DNA-binding NarL/FixJ family response regulator
MEYGMSRHRVLLVCPQQLFGESIEEILSIQADMELIETCGLDDNVHQRIIESRPDVVVLVGVDLKSDEMTYLTSEIIERHFEISIIRVYLAENVIRVFSTYLRPAQRNDFLDVIRNLHSL